MGGRHRVNRDLRALAALRRSEFEAYAREPAPPDRFETRSPLGEPGAAGPGRRPGAAR